MSAKATLGDDDSRGKSGISDGVHCLHGAALKVGVRATAVHLRSSRLIGSTALLFSGVWSSPAQSDEAGGGRGLGGCSDGGGEGVEAGWGGEGEGCLEGRG